VYRFDPAGQPVTTNGWPRGGHASVLTVLGDEAWLIDQGGTCRPLPPGEVRENQGLSLGGPGTMYASGLAREAAGGYWLATSQGLLLFDRRGRQAGERLGGVTGVRALALAADGTAVAAVENGQRLLRFSLDDGPRTPFPANANEPWRVAAGWTNRASALAWDGGRFAVLDEVGRQLWHFDPWHTGWKEETWAELTEPGTLDAPRALAVADTRLWVVAGTRLRELRRGPAPAWNDVVLPETPDPAAVVALAAVDDSAFVLAWPDRLAAFRVAAAGPCTRLWQAEGFQALSGIAPCERGLVAADAKGQRLALLAADTGQVLAEVTADHVPGGMQPGPVAARGAWVLVADEAGKRWLRFRIRAGGG